MPDVRYFTILVAVFLNTSVSIQCLTKRDICMKSHFYCCVRRYRNRERKTLYHISDFMFRFWYRYDSPNKTLLETDAQEIVWKRRIEPDYVHYMGVIFEEICKDYLLYKNSKSEEVILVEAGDMI